MMQENLIGKQGIQNNKIFGGGLGFSGGFGDTSPIIYSHYGQVYDTFTDQVISEYEINQISAVWSGLALISRSISQLPLVLYKRNKETQGLEVHPGGEYALEMLLEDDPRVNMTTVDFIKAITWNMILHGNAYIQVIRDGFGVPRQLVPLYDGSVNPIYDYNPPYYSYRYQVDGVGELQDHQIIHIKNVTSTGREGKSLLYSAQRAFALAAALDRYAGNFFGNGALPGLIFEKDTPMDVERKRKTLEAYVRSHQGVGQSHKPAIFDDGLKAKILSFKNEESQMDQSRERAVLEIARYMQIPPHMLGVLNSEPKANFTEAYLMYKNNVIDPYLYNIETAINQKLLTHKERRTKRLCFKFDSTPLVLGNALDRAKAIQTIANLGNTVKVNEARRRAGLDPVSKEEGGEDFIKASSNANSINTDIEDNDFDFNREREGINRLNYAIK